MARNSKSDLNIQIITLEHLAAVISTHFAAFPDSALTKLGREAVSRYYEWLVIGPHDAVNIGIFEDDQLLGFCFSGIFRGAMGGFLERNRSYLIQRVIIRPWLLLNPLFRERAQFAIKRIFKTRSSQRQQPEISNQPKVKPERHFGILSIAINPKYQGSGIAQLLMEYAERSAVERGFSKMGLTVHPSNSRAVRFYEKMGWQRNLTDGQWTGSMSKTLPNTLAESEANE